MDSKRSFGELDKKFSAPDLVNSKCYSYPHTILFIVQVFLIFIVVSSSLINLTFEWGNQNLWTVILTSCLGIIMPNPKLKLVSPPASTDGGSEASKNI